MHGRQQRGGEPCRRRSFGQHMPATTTRTVAASDSSLTSAITADSFCKVLPWWVFVFPEFLHTLSSSCAVRNF